MVGGAAGLGVIPAEMAADEPLPLQMRPEDDMETPTKTRPGVGLGSAPPPPRPAHGYDLPDFDRFGLEDPPAVGPKPSATMPPQSSRPYSPQHQNPQIRLPGVDGRESLDDWRPQPGVFSGAPQPTVPGGPALAAQDLDDDWAKEASMYMNLAGKRGSKEL
jgi:hypothetical protein